MKKKTAAAKPATMDDMIKFLNEILANGQKLTGVLTDQRCAAIARTKLEEYAMWVSRGLLLMQQAKTTE